MINYLILSFCGPLCSFVFAHLSLQFAHCLVFFLILEKAWPYNFDFADHLYSSIISFHPLCCGFRAV